MYRRHARRRVGRPPRRSRRWRWPAVAGLAAALIWIGWAELLPRYVEGKLRARLRAQGFPSATLHVARIGVGIIEVADIALSPELRADRARLETSLGGLLRGEIERVVLAGARGRVRAPESLTAWAKAQAGPERPSLPFDLVIEDARVQLVDAERVADVEATATLTRTATGHRFALAASAAGPTEWQAAGHRVRAGAIEIHLRGEQSGSSKRTRWARVRVRATGLVLDQLALGDLQVLARTAPDETTATLTQGAGSLWLSAPGPVQRLAALDVQWKVRGTLPLALVDALRRQGVIVDGADLEGQGRARWRPSRRAIAIERARLQLRAARVIVPARELELVESRLDVRPLAEVTSGGVRIDVAAGSRVQARRIFLGSRRLSLAGVRGELFALPGRQPAIALRDGSLRITTEIRGDTPIALGGSMRGRVPRSRLRVDLTLDGGGARGGGRGTLLASGDARDVHLAGNGLSLARGRFQVPLGWGTRPKGWVRGDLAYHGRPLGWVEATLVARERHHDVSARVRIAGGGRLAATGRVLRGPRGLRGRFELEMRAQRMALGPVTEGLFDQRIDGSGTVALRGELDLSRDRSRGWVRGRLSRATLRPIPGVRIDGAVARFELPHLFPAITTPEQVLVFARGRAGQARLGPGWMRMRVTEGVAFARAWMRFAGGSLRTSRFRLNARPKKAPIFVDVDALDLARLASLLEADVRARGRISGRITVHVGPSHAPSIRIGAGVLRSQGGGHLALADPALVSRLLAAHSGGKHVGDVLRARITGALADFEYSQLRLEMRDGAAPRLQARVDGRGRRVPQELSLTLRARGLDAITDHPLDLLTRLSIRPKPRSPRTP